MNQRDDMNQTVTWQVHWGRLLRTARQIAGLSLTELAATTGLSKGYLSKLESGHTTALNPSRATLASLAQALPSFGPIAHSLGPVADVGPVAMRPAGGEVTRLRSPLEPPDREPPIALGWPELELVVAIVTLDHAAVMQPITSIVIARAVGRARAAIEPVLKRLTEMRVLRKRPPTYSGGPVSYECAADFETRVGITRPGDALVLAAALLAEVPARARRSHSSPPSQIIGNVKDSS